jgi:hypothetical protein
MNSKIPLKILEVLDYVIFGLLPGACFLWYTFGVVQNLDDMLRSGGHTNILMLMYLQAIAFVASIFFWIVVPWAIDPDSVESRKNGKSFFINLLVFLMSFGSLVFFAGQENYIKYFAGTGFLMYIGVFFADTFYMASTTFHKIFVSKEKKSFSTRSLFLLSVYYFVCLFVPAGFVIYKFFDALFLSGISPLIFISLIFSFGIKIASRFLLQKKKVQKVQIV